MPLNTSKKDDATAKLADKAWRIDNLYRCQTKDKKVVGFTRNAAQREFNALKTNRNILLKSRQLGFTTDILIDKLDEALFNLSFDHLTIAHLSQEAVKIFDKKVDFVWRNIPKELRRCWNLNTNQSKLLKFGFGENEEGGEEFSSIGVSESGRSGTFHSIHVSEMGKMCAKNPFKVEELFTGTLQTVPFDGEITIESTAEGEIGDYHDMFWEAWNRQGQKNFDPKTMTKLATQYAAFFFNWQWDIEEIAKVGAPFPVSETFKKYQEKHGLTDIEICYYYLKWESVKRKWNRLHQEYPTTPEEAFVSSGEKLFNSDKIKEFNIKKPVKEFGKWTLFERYDQRHHYALGADVSEGVGEDSCAAAILNLHTDTLKPKVTLAARFIDNQIAPDMFAYKLRDMGTVFGGCLIAVERNNHGHATLATLKRIYSRHKIYKEIKEDKITKEKTEKLGWLTSLITKPKMFFELASAVDYELIDIADALLAHEMRIYGKEKLNLTKADPEATQHFDLLTACTIAFQMRTEVKSSGVASSPNQVVGGVQGFLEGVDAPKPPPLGGIGGVLTPRSW